MLQVKPEEVGAEVEWALNCGYRLIDAAHAYQNEKEIGIALHKFFQCGKLKREDVFVITKVGVYKNIFKFFMLKC